MEVTLRKFATRRKACYGPSIGFKFDGFDVCCLGSKVPEWFRYRRRRASITIELDQPSPLLGFFLCCVISRPCPSDVGSHYVQACCDLGDGQWEICENGNNRVGGLKSDHVCMWEWHRPSRCTTINQEISFLFRITFHKYILDKNCKIIYGVIVFALC